MIWDQDDATDSCESCGQAVRGLRVTECEGCGGLYCGECFAGHDCGQVEEE